MPDATVTDQHDAQLSGATCSMCLDGGQQTGRTCSYDKHSQLLWVLHGVRTRRG